MTIELGFGEAARGAEPTLTVTRFSGCEGCGATGAAGGSRCAQCQGRGVRRASERIAVAIPAGVDSGVQLRVPGEGHAGPFGGPRGDLLVSTRVREHPFFARKGDSVHCDVPISVWEALRGARITIPTPTGESIVVVPPGTSSGQVFRLRGQGLPRLADGGTGDLFVAMRVEIPRGLDSRTDELLRDLERLIPMAPRTDLEHYRGGAE
jgi:molecular chaperone DnaJ